MEDIIMRVRHSKLLALIGAGILAVTALVACGNGDAATAQPSAVESSAAESTVAESSAAAPAETTTDLSGSISMVGSTSMEKLANALSEAFMEEYPDVTVTAEFVGSGAGIEAVTNGTADIGNSSRSLKDEEKAAGVVENVVAIDGIAVCVDPANEVADLTKEQLTNIYNGTVTNWKEVGGDDAEIFVVSREESSGTRSAFEELYRFLTTHHDDEKYRYAMVGYQLGNTLTDNGSVARGICVTDENGYLQEIAERTKIVKTEDGAAYTEDDGKTWIPVGLKTPVSMNMWAFSPSIINELQNAVDRFFAEEVEKNPLKSECFLPIEVDKLLKAGKATVEVLHSADKWFGVTYPEDRQSVVDKIKALVDAGEYPAKLF